MRVLALGIRDGEGQAETEQHSLPVTRAARRWNNELGARGTRTNGWRISLVQLVNALLDGELVERENELDISLAQVRLDR